MIGTETEKYIAAKNNENSVKLKEYKSQSFDYPKTSGTDNNALDLAPKDTSNEDFRAVIKLIPFNGETRNAVESKSTKLGKWRQVLAAFGAFMGSMSMGAALAWPATALPDLRRNPQFSHITPSQESWVTSLMTLGAAIACPVAGYCIDKFGRRLTMLLNTFPFLAGSLLIIFAPDVNFVCAGRFVSGFSVGLYTISAPVFIGEIAEKHIRGALSSGFELMVTVGQLYIYLIGTYASMQMQALAVAVAQIACFVLLLLVPESPRYLLQTSKYEQATRSLMWYRGMDSSVDIDAEYQETKTNVEEQARNRVSSAKTLFTRPLLKPLAIAFGLMFFQQMSGIDAVVSYTVDIFQSAEANFDENWSTNILGAVGIVSIIASSFIIDKYGRKILLIISGSIQGLSLFGLAGYFYARDVINEGTSMPRTGWIPITSLIIYYAGFCIGYGPVVWVMMGEILPPQIKGLAAGSVITFRWLLGFMVTKLFKDLLILLGDHGAYFSLGVICFVAGFFIYYCVPETKGKSLDEIQHFFAPKPALHDNNEMIAKL